jgi:hypothetical protein
MWFVVCGLSFIVFEKKNRDVHITPPGIHHKREPPIRTIKPIPATADVLGLVM